MPDRLPPDTRSHRDDNGALFLTDERLREAIELMFFAYRDFTRDPDRILAEIGLGRAHHRAIHFIGRRPGGSVADLLETLDITKQSLNRVLNPLIKAGYVEWRADEKDRRRRLLFLTASGAALEQRLSKPQRIRMRQAFREAPDGAVPGFLEVLKKLIDREARDTALARVYQKEE